MAKPGGRSGQRRPLESTIPDDFAGKHEIEERCLQVLDELGRDWFIRITLDQKSRWGLAIGSHVPGRTSPVIRNVHVHPQDQHAAGMIRLLRPRIDEIRRDTNARFGMLPLTPLPPHVAEDLHAWVHSMGGAVGPDGWVWLPDTASWPAFLELAARAGATYAAEVR